MTNDLACAELVERITDLMEGAVDAATRRDLLQHLADCDGCQTYAEQFQAIVRSLRSLPPEPADSPAQDVQHRLTEAYRRRSAGWTGRSSSDAR